MLSTALIIFVRHPEPGKVKTRLAKVIGDKKALLVYQLLLQHTKQITSPLSVQKFVYYADTIEEYDLWNEPGFIKRRQSGSNLGERMATAFKDLFNQGFNKVLIIGSDCYQLKSAMIEEAFNLLDSHVTVIGPTFDGGYYLLGMTHFIHELFQDKAWSTDQVCEQTIADLDKLALSFVSLEQLYDVDEASDLEFNGISV